MTYSDLEETKEIKLDRYYARWKYEFVLGNKRKPDWTSTTSDWGTILLGRPDNGEFSNREYVDWYSALSVIDRDAIYWMLCHPDQ